MSNAQERKAVADGYWFTGVYHRSYERDEAKARAAEFRAEGFKTRLVNVEGGVKVYAKDTPMTLAAEAEKAKVDETKRVAKAKEVHQYLAGLDVSKLSINLLTNLHREVQRLVEHGF